MKRNDEMQNRLQRLYGPATEDCRQRAHELCVNLKEEPQVKRFSSAALVLALVLLLAGVALAAQQIGTFDFLFPGKTVPETVEAKRQSGFTQIGDAYEDVEITVVDAVSDGVQAYMAINVKAKNKDDVILSEYDRQARQKPSAIGQTLVVAQYNEVGQDLYLTGQWFKAVDSQTVAIHLVIDIKGKPENEPIEITLAPAISLVKDENYDWEKKEQHELVVTIMPSAMEQATCNLAEPVNLKEIGAEMISARLTVTPLANYLSMDIRSDAQAEGGLVEWQHTYGSLWFRLLDANGKELGLLTGGGQYGDDAAMPYVVTVVQVFERGELDWSKLTLVPYIAGEDRIFAPIELTMQPD